jgi:glycosyltransferase involved in cell wall biosynthesis
MWTKNGERFLPEVLKRIDDVIPLENVNKKILVDDHSVDKTTEIAKDFGWSVYKNPKGGIPYGANEALKHVTTPFFISFEQDLLLAKNWWEKIPKHMENSMVVCAQGIRVSTNITLRKLEEYAYARKSKGKFQYVSMDNNIFRTKVIREIGGFPTACPGCTDTILMKRIIYETPYKWIIDKSVISLHIRPSIKREIQHQYKSALLCSSTPYCWEQPTPLRAYIRMLATSPLSGLRITLRKSEPNIFWAYPTLRFMALKAFLDKKKMP